MPTPRYTIDMLSPVQTTTQAIPTYDQLGPVTPTVAPIGNDDDLPTVTVQGRFDWKFWVAVGLGVYALYILTQSGKRAARHG